jgi:hypothetical protein
MNIKTKLVLATLGLALLSAPASARIDGDEGGASAFPRFHSERSYRADAASAYASGAVIGPRQRVQRPNYVSHPRPQR